MQLEWPPSFKLRHSDRARTVRLQICPRRGLQLIVPKRFNPKKAHEVLEQHRAWIEKTWQKIQPKISNSAEQIAPMQIDLLAINQCWKIKYLSNEDPISVSPESGAHHLSIRSNDYDYICKYLKSWVFDRAEEYLLPSLKRLSESTGLHFSSVSIRNNSSRWGSCSIEKKISLNCKLLFLPPSYVEHILLHELCHTVHMDHSRAFWNLLTKLDPRCHKLRKAIKLAEHFVPNWLEK